MKILLNFIGILIFFLIRFDNRKDKTTEPSPIFWIKDNWPELLTILLFDIALMLLVIVGGFQINFEKFLPDAPTGVIFVGDMAECFFVGVVVSWLLYEAVNKFFKNKS